MKSAPISGWDGFVWERGDLAIGFVPRLGGRIMSIRFHGEEMLFTDPRRGGEVFSPEQLAGDKKEFGFRVWGGNKTWIAPEKQWLHKIPPLDLDAGEYLFEYAGDLNTVTMISPVCRETGQLLTRKVSLGTDEMVFVETLTNKSASPVTRGLWNVTQLNRPFLIFCPAGRADVRLYEDEDFRSCRPDDCLRSCGEWTGIRCEDNSHFKFGAASGIGKMIAIRAGAEHTVSIAFEFSVIPGAKYAHGSNVEVYNSPNFSYCEAEIHSPLITLQPEQSFSFSHRISLRKYPARMEAAEILKTNPFSQFAFDQMLL